MQTVRSSVVLSLSLTVLFGAGYYVWLNNHPLADSAVVSVATTTPSTTVLDATNQAIAAAQPSPAITAGLILLVLLMILVITFVAVYLGHRPQDWRQASQPMIRVPVSEAAAAPSTRQPPQRSRRRSTRRTVRKRA